MLGCESRATPTRTWQASDHAQPAGSQIDPSRIPGSRGATDAATRAADVAQTLWGAQCATCHGAEGRGDGNPLPAGVDFTDPVWQEARTDDQIKAAIFEGKPPMPAYGDRVSAAQLDALVKVVRAFSARPTTPDTRSK